MCLLWVHKIFFQNFPDLRSGWCVCVLCVWYLWHVCLYFSVSLDSSSSRKTYSLCTLYGSSSLQLQMEKCLAVFCCWKIELSAFFLWVDHPSWCASTLWDFKLRNAFYFGGQGFLKIEIAFQNCCNRWENGEKGGERREESIERSSSIAKINVISRRLIYLQIFTVNLLLRNQSVAQ